MTFSVRTLLYLATLFLSIFHSMKDQYHKIKSCPNEHNLKKEIIDKEGYECNICENSIGEGKRIYGCDECDFHVCDGCVIMNTETAKEVYLGMTGKLEHRNGKTSRLLFFKFRVIEINRKNLFMHKVTYPNEGCEDEWLFINLTTEKYYAGNRKKIQYPKNIYQISNNPNNLLTIFSKQPPKNNCDTFKAKSEGEEVRKRKRAEEKNIEVENDIEHILKLNIENEIDDKQQMEWYYNLDEKDQSNRITFMSQAIHNYDGFNESVKLDMMEEFKLEAKQTQQLYSLVYTANMNLDDLVDEKKQTKNDCDIFKVKSNASESGKVIKSNNIGKDVSTDVKPNLLNVIEDGYAESVSTDVTTNICIKGVTGCLTIEEKDLKFEVRTVNDKKKCDRHFIVFPDKDYKQEGDYLDLDLYNFVWKSSEGKKVREGKILNFKFPNESKCHVCPIEDKLCTSDFNKTKD